MDEPALERALALTDVAIPDDVNQRLEQAAARAARRRVASMRLRTAAGALALAAATALAFFATRPAPAIAGDLNRDGRVDILDAQKLARGVAAGKVAPAWDLDGNGVVDSRDADFAARAVVRIEKGAGG